MLVAHMSCIPMVYMGMELSCSSNNFFIGNYTGAQLVTPVTLPSPLNFIRKGGAI